jgi:hypothetical protein
VKEIWVSVSFAACALVISVPCSAQDEPDWLRVAAPNNGFTAETPCSTSEIDALREFVPQGLTPQMSAVYSDFSSRIVCMKDGQSFLVSVLSRPEYVTPGKTLFDFFVTQLGTATPDGRPAVTEISGRRALINNQTAEGIFAESGIIEAGRDRVVLYNVGVRPSQAGSNNSSIGRFRESIRIGGE